MSQKIVVCGAGFLGKSIAKALCKPIPNSNILRRVQISSRSPDRVYNALKAFLPASSLLPPAVVDITTPATLAPAFDGADVVISLVGILHGTPQEFDDIQWKGAENVARAARAVGAKLVHISAIGADKGSSIPYARTKGLGEEAVLDLCKDSTIVRPSLVFGPGDDFFNRFARLSQFLPFMPVFGGGTSRFQPVYVDDVANVVEIVSRLDPEVQKRVSGKIIEAGGPDVFTYREIMELVLRYTGRRRPIVSLPWAVGMVQGAILERLPSNLFTVTQSQVEQLKLDNVVSGGTLSAAQIVESPPRTVHEILPTYLH